MIRGTSVMCAPDRMEMPDGVGVLLDGGLDDLLRRLVQAGVDDLHARVAQRAGDDLGAAVVTVEPGLGDDDSESRAAPRGCPRASRAALRGHDVPSAALPALTHSILLRPADSRRGRAGRADRTAG